MPKQKEKRKKSTIALTVFDCILSSPDVTVTDEELLEIIDLAVGNLEDTASVKKAFRMIEDVYKYETQDMS